MNRNPPLQPGSVSEYATNCPTSVEAPEPWDDVPRLIEASYQGFNLVSYRGAIHALSLRLGPVDLPYVSPKQLQPHIGRLAFINSLMLFCGSDYWNHPEEYGIRFHSDREALYRDHLVAIPDETWHSENPYIDREVRYAPVSRILASLKTSGMALGDYAQRVGVRLEQEQETPSDTPNPAVADDRVERSPSTSVNAAGVLRGSRSAPERHRAAATVNA